VLNLAQLIEFTARRVPDKTAVIRRHERTGRPLGDAGFIARLESQLGRFLRKCKPGPKRKKIMN